MLEYAAWIIGGLFVVAIAAGVAYAWKNRGRLKPTMASPGDLVQRVVDGMGPISEDIQRAIAAEVAKVPGLVSAEVSQLRAQTGSLIQDLRTAQTALATEKAAHDRLKAAVAVIRDVPPAPGQPAAVLPE